MIANLKQIVLLVCLPEKILVAALLPVTFAVRWNADLTAVEAAQAIRMIQIQNTG